MAKASANNSLLTPRLLSQLGDLQIVARRLSASLRDGIQRSRQAGSARDFTSYRHYQPGDDLRQLDWKLFARSDRHYVRESELDRNQTVRLILDATASMSYAEAGLSKWQVARTLAAALAWLAHRQGDLAGLEVIAGTSPMAIPPSRDRLILQRILHALTLAEPAGAWPPAARQSRGTREVIFVLTDLHQISQEIRDWLQHCALSRNEVTVIQITGPAEEAFDFAGDVLLEELETGREMRIDAGSIRADFLAARAAHRVDFAREMTRLGVRIFPVSMAEPVGSAIRHLLQ